MRYQEKVMGSSIGGFFITRYAFWRKMMLVVTAIINAGILSFWEGNPNVDDPVPVTPSSYDTFLLVFGGIHIFTTFCVVVTYFLLNPPQNPLSKETRKKVMAVVIVLLTSRHSCLATSESL